MTPPASVITFAELLAYTAAEHERWHRWCSAHPDALGVPYGDAPLATVRDVVRHIGFVERRYAAILAGAAMPPAPADTLESPDRLFAWLHDGRRLFLTSVESAHMDHVVEFMTLTAGRQQGTARKITAHALMHGIRHWAQLATVLRERGHPTDWPHDLLLSGAMR